MKVSGKPDLTLTVQNQNIFKRDPGVSGFVLTLDGVNSVAGTKVQLYEKTKLLGTVTTDEDGFYTFKYNYTGKPTTLTIKMPEFNAQQSVGLKSNGWVYVSFSV